MYIADVSVNGFNSGIADLSVCRLQQYITEFLQICNCVWLYLAMTFHGNDDHLGVTAIDLLPTCPR